MQRPSVRPCVCPIDKQQQQRWPARSLLSALWAGDIDRQLRALISHLTFYSLKTVVKRNCVQSKYTHRYSKMLQ